MKHRLAPHPPAAALRPHLPLWAYGLEGDWLLRHQAAGLAVLAAGAPKFSILSARVAAWGFERAPLDPALAAAAREAGRPLDDAPARRALTRELARRLVRPANAHILAPLAQAPDPGPALAFLAPAMDDPRHGLYWRGKAFALALSRGLPELARQAVAPLLADPALTPLGARLALEAALAWDGPAAWQTTLSRLDPNCFPRYAALAQAHLLAEAGQREAAAEVLATLWREENWHPDLTARLAALLAPPPAADLNTLPGALHVFVYTWNRAALLRPTLERLAESRLGPARVTVLDNGATDDTAAVCRAMAGGFAPGRFGCLTLPVNIGAPAARNWLARVAGLGPDDLAAYLDDDALVAPDWLEQLAGALAADPEADVAGARVVADAPGAARVAQAADVRLLPPDEAHAVRPLVNTGPGPDLGLLAVVRACASVSGCCHLLRARALTGPTPPFDIRFSPSQFDDLARDLAGFTAGGRAVYVGTTAVAHRQHAGPGQAKSAAAVGQLLGARAKLDGRFSRQAMEQAAGRDLDLAWACLGAAFATVRQRLDD